MIVLMPLSWMFMPQDDIPEESLPSQTSPSLTHFAHTIIIIRIITFLASVIRGLWKVYCVGKSEPVPASLFERLLI